MGFKKIITAGDLSADIDQAAGDSVGVFKCGKTDLIAFLFDTTGATSPTGDFELEVSHDWDPIAQTGTWTQIDGGTTLHSPAGTAGRYATHYRGCAGAFYKVWWDDTSGSGTCNVYVAHGELK